MGRKIVASRVGGLIELLGNDEERGWLVKIVPWESCDYDAPELDEEAYARLADRIADALADPHGDGRTDGQAMHGALIWRPGPAWMGGAYVGTILCL